MQVFSHRKAASCQTTAVVDTLTNEKRCVAAHVGDRCTALMLSTIVPSLAVAAATVVGANLLDCAAWHFLNSSFTCRSTWLTLAITEPPGRGRVLYTTCKLLATNLFFSVPPLAASCSHRAGTLLSSRGYHVDQFLARCACAGSTSCDAKYAASTCW